MFAGLSPASASQLSGHELGESLGSWCSEPLPLPLPLLAPLVSSWAYPGWSLAKGERAFEDILDEGEADDELLPGEERWAGCSWGIFSGFLLA